jgi:hypothetical protein
LIFEAAVFGGNDIGLSVSPDIPGSHFDGRIRMNFCPSECVVPSWYQRPMFQQELISALPSPVTSPAVIGRVPSGLLLLV